MASQVTWCLYGSCVSGGKELLAADNGFDPQEMVILVGSRGIGFEAVPSFCFIFFFQDFTFK